MLAAAFCALRYKSDREAEGAGADLSNGGPELSYAGLQIDFPFGQMREPAHVWTAPTTSKSLSGPREHFTASLTVTLKIPLVPFFFSTKKFLRHPGCWSPPNVPLIKKSAIVRLSCFLFLVDPGSTNSSIGCVWKSSGLVSDEGPSVREEGGLRLPSFWNPIKCFIPWLRRTWG